VPPLHGAPRGRRPQLLPVHLRLPGEPRRPSERFHTRLSQICRFCWHRIRTDENGLCPACRKAYSEDPADFTPLSQEQVAKLKAEKRQRDQQRKAKLSESRKHLASVRVVQRNLVFVVGLPMRLADPEVLKRHEYFGKFGKIHKVVINQSTSYAGSQGPSASKSRQKHCQRAT
jgi:CCR4-NOT transcription complex subunit 4